MREFYAKYNMIQLPDGQHRRTDGRLVSQRNKSAADFNGLKFRVGGFAGKVCTALALCHKTGGEIYQARKKAPSTHASGLARTMTRSSASTSGTTLLLPRLVGGGPRLDVLKGLRRAHT